jgi:putative Mn2+ efflux pump MntP
MSQTRIHSMVEAMANTVVGIALSLAAVQWAFPLFGVNMTLTENLISTGLMTILSVIRSYALRRFFNWLQWRGA